MALLGVQWTHDSSFSHDASSILLLFQAARESRRRKKVMIEELQRSVIFFSRANSTLKQQNDDLTRMLLQAQTMISQMNDDSKLGEQGKEGSDGMTVNASQSYLSPTSTRNPSAPSFTSLPPMQPGATMQAMSNFQQAASIAMQQAMQGLQSIPGINMNQLTAAPAGASAQQAYTDTMTALAMQQAAMAAAAGHPFNMQQGFPHPAYNPYMWPGSPHPMMQPNNQTAENNNDEAPNRTEADGEGGNS